MKMIMLKEVSLAITNSCKTCLHSKYTKFSSLCGAISRSRDAKSQDLSGVSRVNYPIIP
ncbi:hypothetical protein Hanom_Chr12g01152281 [Helianthus anomalus]